MSEQAEHDVFAAMQAWVIEAGSLRQEAVKARPPARPADPGRFYEYLLEVRGWLDRMTELLSNAQALRGGLSRKFADAQAEYEDAWDEESRRLRKSGRDDYSTGRERQAEADLRVFARKRDARKAKRYADLAAEGEARVRLQYQGLNDTRQDILAALRYLAFETHLER